MIINTSETLFLIPPTFDPLVARNISRSTIEGFHTAKPTPPLRPILNQFLKVHSKEDFALAIDDLVINGYKIRSNTNMGRICDLLIALWSNDCIAFPRESTKYMGRFHGGVIFRNIKVTTPHPQEIIQTLRKVNSFRSKVTLIRRLTSVIFSIVGVKEVGDLTPTVVDGSLLGVKGSPSLANLLTTAIRDRHGVGSVTFSSNDYGPFGRQAAKTDNEFKWIIDKNPELTEWKDLAREWLDSTIKRDVNRRRIGVAQFLTYLVEHAHLPRKPADFLSSGSKIDPLFGPKNSSAPMVAAVGEYIDWILNTHFIADDDHGHPYRLPGFRNPVLPTRYPLARPAETVRDAMPTRFVRRLKEILEENDFAWPKSAFEKGSDTIRWKDPITGEWMTVWSPVRTFAILMKLELPERTFQIRVCNSGEADLERYDPENDLWYPNAHQLAGDTPYSKPMGLARKILDHRTGKMFTGLYFNTNKTGDIGKAPEDRGHVIPWQNERVLSLYHNLRSWQEKYNPIERPTKWTDLREDTILKKSSQDVLLERGAETFLFRDPCSRYTDQPLAHTRLTIFWNKLCTELENRLAREGETAPGGQRIQLVIRGKDGDVSGTIYNLHSLRVTMITAWAEAGVPIDVLMKVAGHATAIMTIYYQKLSISHVTDVLNGASTKMMLNEQGNWQAWIRSKSYDDLEKLVAYNDIISLRSFSEAANASLSRRDYGICPVGCGRCHEGGSLVEGNVNKKYHPVPGGPQNCVRCRFFITGPCFLLGLQAHFDEVGFRYREASRAYVAATTEFEKLDHLRKRATADGRPFTDHHRLEVLSSTADQRTREVDELALTWHAAYNLIQQCIELLRRPTIQGDIGNNYLITVGAPADFEYALELDETGEREFELLDKMCHSAVFFSFINPQIPNMYRMRHFDQLLRRNGFEPIFFEMTEEEAFAAGNTLSRFLYTRFGRENVNGLMTGSNVLRTLGVDAEEAFSSKLSEVTGRKIDFRSRHKRIDLKG